jgi:hypothetical protein
MTTISSPERTGVMPEIAEVCAVLRRAADRLAGLPHARVGRVDLYIALRKSGSDSYPAAQAALEVLTAHLPATGGDNLWVHRWSVLRNRQDAVVLMRDAADAAEQAAAVSR